MTTGRTPKKKHQRLHHGEGSFHYRASDGRWVGTIEAGWTAKGKRRRIVVTDRDEDAAWDKLMAKRKVLLAEGRAAALQKNTTVAVWMERWLKVQETHLRPNSYNGAASYVRRWIIPTIGRRPLDELSGDDIRKVARAVIDAGRSSTTAGTIQGVLQKALRDAVAEDYTVPDSALLAAKPAKDRSRKRSAIPTDQAMRLLQAADTMPDGSRWAAALLQGMRQGERLGLRWDALDFDQKMISISWQLQELVKRETGVGYRVPDGYEVEQLEGRWHLVRPKSTAGVREVPMTPWMEAALTQWRDVAPVSPHGLVWSLPGGGLLTDRRDRADWRVLQDKAGVWKRAGDPPTYYQGHEARHSTATLLLEAGVDPEVVKAIMGHSDVVTTAGYQHVSRSLMRAALEAVEGQLRLSQAHPQLEG